MGQQEQDNPTFIGETDIGEYLMDRLDAQRGRAEAYFREFLLAEKPSTESPPMRSAWFHPWKMGVLGTALAASLAAVWVVPLVHRPIFQAQRGSAIAPTSGFATVGQAASHPMFVEQDVQTETFDQGISMLEHDKPVRVLLRRDLHRTRWFDEDRKLRQEQVIPQDNVICVEMKTY